MRVSIPINRGSERPSRDLTPGVPAATRRNGVALGFSGTAGHFLVVFGVWLLMFSAHADATVESTAVLEQFKSFVSSPPPINEIIYAVRLLADPSKPEDGVAHSPYFQIYAAAWQTNGWIVRAIRRPDTAGDKTIVGRTIFFYQDEYWHLEPNAAIHWIDDDPIVQGVKIELLTKTVNRTKPVARFLKLGLSEVLNAGVNNIAPGTIEWQSNHFSAQFREEKQTIQGELFADSDGRPSRMDVSYSSGTNRTPVRIEYEYQTNVGLPFFPNRIRSFRLGKSNKEIEQSDLTILSVKAASEPLPQSAFDAFPFIATNRLAIRYYTNGALYEFDKRGELILAKDELPRHLGQPRPSSALFYSVAAGGTAIFFALAFRTKRSKTTNETKGIAP